MGATMQNNGKKDGQLDAIRPDSRNVKINFTHLIFH